MTPNKTCLKKKKKQPNQKHFVYKKKQKKSKNGQITVWNLKYLNYHDESHKTIFYYVIVVLGVHCDIYKSS
jgi:hypothetical protein